ncbi:TPA: hypothetical protein P0E13_005203 [Vibrio harveyi]|uniref:hypothetical protein n=1 Tax=Vibrio harveyi group TaxID=717610 RepID=UPI0005EFF31D|nr:MULTISPECIES: hypothetical protein [Vibrio harveyi group]HDM8161924.1 hypothetical protein [Vibrio harveyi]
MSSYKFYFCNSQLSNSAEYLIARAVPKLNGLSKTQIIELIKEDVVSQFDRIYTNQPQTLVDINAGIIEGPVVWSGLFCMFTSSAGIGGGVDSYSEVKKSFEFKTADCSDMLITVDLYSSMSVYP